MTLCTLMPWIIGLGSALLGGLIGWYFKKSNITQEDVMESEAYGTLNEDYQRSMSGHQELKSQYAQLSAHHEEARAKVASHESDLVDWTNRYSRLDAQHSAYQATSEATLAEKAAALVALKVTHDAVVSEKEAEKETYVRKASTLQASYDTQRAEYHQITRKVAEVEPKARNRVGNAPSAIRTTATSSSSTTC